jgi:hypothetical protein
MCALRRALLSVPKRVKALERVELCRDLYMGPGGNANEIIRAGMGKAWCDFVCRLMC